MAYNLRTLILMSFVLLLGLSVNFSSSYVPQQNSVAECNNQTLIQMTRMMIYGHKTSWKY